MDYAHYQFLKFLGSSPPITKKQGVSREYGTDFWRLSDIPAKSGMVGKKQNPRSSGIFPTYENQALVRLGLVKNRSCCRAKGEFNKMNWVRHRSRGPRNNDKTVHLPLLFYCGWLNPPFS